jgi:hypothetical protein
MTPPVTACCVAGHARLTIIGRGNRLSEVLVTTVTDPDIVLTEAEVATFKGRCAALCPDRERRATRRLGKYGTV